MNKFATLSCAALAVMLGAHLLLSRPSVAQAQARFEDHDSPNLITVNGAGKSLAEPDEATTTLGVEVVAVHAKEAQDLASERTSAIIAALRKLGIRESQIRSARINIHAIYEPRDMNRPVTPRIISYRATNMISVRITNLDQAGQVIDAGLDAGANRLDTVRLVLRDDARAREAAIRQAVREGRANARTAAGEAGVRLGRLHRLIQGGVTVNYPYYWDYWYGGFGGGGMGGGGGSPSTPVSPGQVEVQASVTLQYEVQQ